MSDVSVRDELDYDALPVETRELAEKVLWQRFDVASAEEIKDAAHATGYDKGVESGYAEGFEAGKEAGERGDALPA